VGAFVEHGILGRLDSAENILANKITAVMDRNEPKDMADIWGFCCRRGGGKLRDQGSSSSWQKR
jgi:hypothetical protein